MKKYNVTLIFKNETILEFTLNSDSLKKCRLTVFPQKYRVEEYYFLELVDADGKEVMYAYKLKEIVSMTVKEI